MLLCPCISPFSYELPSCDWMQSLENLMKSFGIIVFFGVLFAHCAFWVQVLRMSKLSYVRTMQNC